MKRISQLLILMFALTGTALAQAPYVIYYAVDELYSFTTPIPLNNITSVNLSFYDKNTALSSNFYPSGLYTSVDHSHEVDHEVKANYVYSNYGSTPTGDRASYKNSDRAYRRELVASVTSTYTQSNGNIHKGHYATIATFDNDMPKVVDFSQVFELAGFNGGSSKLTYGIKGTFAMVSEVNTYPKLVSPINAQLPYVSTQFATLEVPEFYRYFPQSQIGWKQDDKEIKGVTGYSFTFSKDYPDTSFKECGLHSYQPFIKDPKFAFWTAGTITIELSPNLKLGTDITVSQPLCAEMQSQEDSTKFDGFLIMQQAIYSRAFRINLFDKNNIQEGESQFDKFKPKRNLDYTQAPWRIQIEEVFSDNRNSCAQFITNVIITPPKPISISDTLFKDILCFGDKPHLDINIDGNTTGYTLAYGDSTKTLTKGLNQNIPLMQGSKNYTFTISDQNGCVFEQALNFKAKEPSRLEATFNIVDALCHDNNATVNIDAKGGSPYFKQSSYRYTYTPTMVEMGNPTASIKAGTKLSMSLHDAHGCLVSFADTILYNPADFKLSVLQKQENVCPKGTNASIQLSGISTDKRYVYSYSKDGKTYGNEALFTGLNSGTLSFQTKNQFGCIRDTTVHFIEPPFITISKTAVDSVRCAGESNGALTLNVTGGTGSKKLWEQNLGQPQGLRPYKYGGLADRSYIFYVQDSLGCMDSVAYDIGTRSNIKHTLTATNPACNESADGQLQIVNSGGYGNYQNEWLSPNGLSDDLLQTGLSKGTYILRSLDALGCSKVDTFILTAPPMLQVDLKGYPLLCKGQSLDLDAGIVAPKYEWSSLKGFKANTKVVVLTEADIYTLKVTNGFGCTGSDTFELKTSDTEFKTELWVASTVAQGDTVVMVDNNAEIDSLVWNLGNGIGLPALSDFRSQFVVFDQMGEQEIGVTGYYKGCRDVVKRKIMVVSLADRIKNDRSLGIKVSVFKECGLFPNPNDGSFAVHFELTEPDVPIAMMLSSTTTGSVLKNLPLKVYPDGKVEFSEDLPEGSYVVHVKARDEVLALRFLVAYD